MTMTRLGSNGRARALEVAMGGPSVSGGVSREVIERAILEILNELTQDWDTDYSGDIGPETLLVDELAFESIDVVQLVVSIESRFERRDLPFEKLLMNDGRYVDDMTVRQIVDFLEANLVSTSREASDG
jgi:acyl carrier protein